FGTLLILLGGGSRWQFASPGSLSSPHALSSCSDCHHLPAAAQNFSSAFKPPHAYQDSQLCLNCHPLGADPFQPHGLSGAGIPPATKVSRTDSSIPPIALAVGSSLLGLPSHSLPCAACHHEHLGQAQKLTGLSNLQCQGCHSRQFESFARGHPDFAQYPFKRRTRIFFDHVA